MVRCAGWPAARRWLTLSTGLVECLCFAGAVFGWASLAFVLKTDGYFSSLCVNATVNGTQVLDCSVQDEQFSLVFTIASFMNNFLTLPNGFLYDRFGTTVARLFGISLYSMGTLLVAFSSSALSILLFPALSFMAVGGILFLVTNMQVGNLFGSHRSTIITLYNGAFDSSSALFFVIKLVFELGVSLRASFLFLSACGVIHLLRTFFLLPKTKIPYPVPEGYTYGMTCGKSDTFTLEQTAPDENIQRDTDKEEKKLAKVGLPLEEKSFRECVLSRLFLWHLLWLSVMQLRHYLFIGTLNPMLQRLTQGEPSLVSQYTNAFAMTQLCGVLCAPWNGLIMDRHKGKPRAAGESEREADLRATVLSLFLTALQCVLFSVCASTPLLPLQYLTFILQVLNRSFLYGGNAAFISVAFPLCHFGKLYGLIMALSAVFSLLQYPCFALVKGVLGGDPLYVNISLTVLSMLAFIHPFSIHMHCRGLAADRAKNRDAVGVY
ncbi:solute carrier family 43 member 3b [Lampris incognitus]|uniref:solute carrier family 43 member 3b n=1 Tax=Lampris incognitus TaxID=2546036 RepID=UPI0024B5C8B0|nr:solute carrier family 43 member 3b [Lampris incognitus]XP_056131595.1 solute carrier family 43 member 3b [Lampris incognitus]XP_056131601.1 solute carrier family 43 member 3b [Lampris incognitus]XP_056131610.1 solute carrier family 43 member 3b [Lampris incognitus]